MIRRSVAGVILGISLLAGSFAWGGFVALRTVLDPDRSREVAEELLDNEQVRLQLVNGISEAIVVAIPVEIPVEDAAVQAAAEQALNNPELEALLLAAFTQTHAAFLGDGDAPENLDLTAVAVSAREALVQASPSLDAVLPTAPVLNISLPTEHVPDASPLRTFLQRVVPVLALGAIGGAVLALVSTTDRPAILRRAGVWGLTTTAVYLIIGLGVPWLLRRIAPDGTEVVSALLAAMLRSIRVPSIVLGLVGAGLLLASVLWGVSSGRGKRNEPDRRFDRDAPHRRNVPAGDPVANPAAGPNGARHGAPGQPLSPPQPTSPYQTHHPSPYPGGGQDAGGSPYAGGASTVGGPYPDRRPQGAPEPTLPSSDPASVFADVPLPRDEPPRPTVNASTPAASPDVPFAPRWVEGHGWVLHPDDPRPVPTNATWIDGIGHVVPGPPPADT